MAVDDSPEGLYFEVATIHHTDCRSTLLTDDELRHGFAQAHRHRRADPGRHARPGPGPGHEVGGVGQVAQSAGRAVLGGVVRVQDRQHAACCSDRADGQQGGPGDQAAALADLQELGADQPAGHPGRLGTMALMPRPLPRTCG